MLEVNTLFAASMSENTWKCYETGLDCFEHFRTLYKLQSIWPPPIDHLVNFVAYLSYMSYSPATIRLYISSVSFTVKCKGLDDTTQSFIVQKMIKGAKNLYHRADIRCPITQDMLVKLTSALKYTCSSQYETLLYIK